MSDKPSERREPTPERAHDVLSRLEHGDAGYTIQRGARRLLMSLAAENAELRGEATRLNRGWTEQLQYERRKAKREQAKVEAERDALRERLEAAETAAYKIREIAYHSTKGRTRSHLLNKIHEIRSVFGIGGYQVPSAALQAAQQRTGGESDGN